MELKSLNLPHEFSKGRLNCYFPERSEVLLLAFLDIIHISAETTTWPDSTTSSVYSLGRRLGIPSLKMEAVLA